jgi:hypothetical protein
MKLMVCCEFISLAVVVNESALNNIMQEHTFTHQDLTQLGTGIQHNLPIKHLRFPLVICVPQIYRKYFSFCLHRPTYFSKFICTSNLVKVVWSLCYSKSEVIC